MVFCESAGEVFGKTGGEMKTKAVIRTEILAGIHALLQSYNHPDAGFAELEVIDDTLKLTIWSAWDGDKQIQDFAVIDLGKYLD